MLVPLTEIKSYLKVTTADWDAFLTMWGEVASDAVELYCRRKFAAANYEETFYSSDFRLNKSLKLFHYPLIVATPADFEIKVDGELLEDETIRIGKQTGMLYYDKGFFNHGTEWTVKYRAGYATLPALIRLVVLSIVEENYNKKKAGIATNFGSNVQRMSIPQVISVDFDYSLTTNEETSQLGTILGSWQNVLAPYRSERTIIGTGRAVFLA